VAVEARARIGRLAAVLWRRARPIARVTRPLATLRRVVLGEARSVALALGAVRGCSGDSFNGVCPARLGHRLVERIAFAARAVDAVHRAATCAVGLALALVDHRDDEGAQLLRSVPAPAARDTSLLHARVIDRPLRVPELTRARRGVRIGAGEWLRGWNERRSDSGHRRRR